MNSLGEHVCMQNLCFDNIKGDEENCRYRNDKVLQFYY